MRALIIDDTGFPKKGHHSVGVARQYCGQLGKQDNCQVAVSLSLAGDYVSLPIAYRLYLPQQWADDAQARAKAGVPEDVVFKTKPQIALDQLSEAKSAGSTAPIVLADAGYGNDTAFREGVTKLGFTYVVSIQSTTSLWPAGEQPLAKKRWSGRGRPTSVVRRDAEHQPISAKALALSLPPEDRQRVTWREGKLAMTSVAPVRACSIIIAVSVRVEQRLKPLFLTASLSAC